MEGHPGRSVKSPSQYPMCSPTGKRFLLFFMAFGSLMVGAGRLAAQTPPAGLDDYVPGPDSMPQEGVPQGKTFSFPFEDSKGFPGTVRTITVYVPAQYTGEKPACVYVGLDALGYRAPVVFDNLIHQGDMPVTIAIGISPGEVLSRNGEENPRHNRSFEFDGLNGSLARFVTDEIFPAVEKQQTPDGLPIRLSRDPNDHCAGGGSTGGIAAFTLAWERPDLFRRVFSSVGTFVGMRGGDRYPVLVRKTEPKPVRVYQQDGENDQWMGGPEVGDWWMSNQTLERALAFAGYDHQFAWGTGAHNGKHATAIFPEAMRFLWKDWPEPVRANTAGTQNVFLKAILDLESHWELVKEAGEDCGHLVVNPQGEIFIQSREENAVRKLGVDGTVEIATGVPSGRAFAYSAEGKVVTVDGEGLDLSCLAVTSGGAVYATDAEAGKVWFVASDGTKTLLDEGLMSPTGIGLSPDGLWLAVMEREAHWGYSYRVKADGSVELKQRFYWMHEPDWASGSGAGNLCWDREGRLYVATHLGVQVLDRNGRSRAILPVTPAHNGAESVCFGGENFDTLFAVCEGRLYRRHLKAIGAPAFLPPIKLPFWGKG